MKEPAAWTMTLRRELERVEAVLPNRFSALKIRTSSLIRRHRSGCLRLRGLYVSSDGGASWSHLPMSENLLHVDAARRPLLLRDGYAIRAYQWEDRTRVMLPGLFVRLTRMK